MKVKVRKLLSNRKPAPVVTEQVPETVCCIGKIRNGYSVPQNLIVDDRISRIPEGRFIEIIDALYYKVHHPTVSNAKAKAYPNFTILEYVDFFGI